MPRASARWSVASTASSSRGVSRAASRLAAFALARLFAAWLFGARLLAVDEAASAFVLAARMFARVVDEVASVFVFAARLLAARLLVIKGVACSGRGNTASLVIWKSARSRDSSSA